MEEQTNQPQPPVTPPIVQSQNQLPSEPKKGLSKWIIVAIAIVVLIIVGGTGAYFLSRNQTKTVPTSTTTPTPIQKAETETQVTPAPTTAAMKTYTSQKLKDIGFSGYTLKHGEDWTVKEERGTEVATANLTLTKGQYSITIQQGPMGGSLCVYEGTLPEGPASDKRGKAYTDIETSFGSLRRNEESGGIGENGFSFCQKNDQDGSYGSFTTVGAMGYSTPANPDEEILSEMDNIIKSIKTL